MPVGTQDISYNSKSVRLSRQILSDIGAGRYASGSMLPSETALAGAYGVSRPTVRRAIAILTGEGRLEKLPQRGVLVPSRPLYEGQIAQIAYVTPALAGETNLYVKGIGEALDPQRHALATYSTCADLRKYQRMIEQLVRLRPAGIILHTMPEEICRIDGAILADAGIPVVIVGQHELPGLPCDWVRDSCELLAQEVAWYIGAKGYRDPVHFTYTPARINRPAIETFRRELSPLGVELPDERIFIFDAPSGYRSPPDPFIDAQRKMAEMLRAGFRCEVLICGHDYPAVGALRAILAAGIKVPQEMKVISLMGSAVDAVSPMKLATMDVHRDLQGQRAAELLLRRIDGYAGPIEVHHIAADLVEGETM